jgi:hypothetical protein
MGNFFPIWVLAAEGCRKVRRTGLGIKIKARVKVRFYVFKIGNAITYFIFCYKN